MRNSREWAQCTENLLSEGKVILFCGSGISLPSGLPTVYPLVDAILKGLDFGEAAREALCNRIGQDLPFEQFMETVVDHSPNNDLLRLFSLGAPSLSHLCIAKLASKGLLKTICTTNFDGLIEAAFKMHQMQEGEHYKVYYEPDTFFDIQWEDPRVQLIKLHGSITDLSHMGVTLRRVAARETVKPVQHVVDYLFSTGPHQAVLIVGYSCSDHFDVNPCIESRIDSEKTILFLQHYDDDDDNVPYGLVEEVARKPRQIRGRETYNPFVKFKSGDRLYSRTGETLQGIAENALECSVQGCSTEEKLDWRKYVRTWITDIKGQYPDLACLYLSGAIRLMAGDHDSSEELFTKAVDKARTLEEGTQWLQGCLSSLGNVHLAKNDLVQASNLFQEALGHARRDGNPYRITQQLLNVSNVYRNWADQLYTAALSMHGEALTLLSEKENPEIPESVRATHLAAKGIAHGRLGDFVEALDCQEQAREILQSLGDLRHMASVQGNIGSMYFSLQEYDVARKHYSEALDSSKQCGDWLAVGQHLINIGNCHARLGDHDSALKLYQEARQTLLPLLPSTHPLFARLSDFERQLEKAP